jgi:hypothetical protein
MEMRPRARARELSILSIGFRGQLHAFVKRSCARGLDWARQHQNGRGTGDVPTGTFFTEYWIKPSASLNEIVVEVLELVREHQTPRVTADVSDETFTDSRARAATPVDVHRRGWISAARNRSLCGLSRCGNG